MTVTVDASRCIACGMCAYAAPEIFRVVGQASTVIAQPGDRNRRPGGGPFLLQAFSPATLTFKRRIHHK